MKYLKTFENKSMEEQIELLNDLINENPLHKDNDFYMFIGRNEFKEDIDGRFRKTLEIERMIKITPDEKSINSMIGLQTRSKFSSDSKLYNIYIPHDKVEIYNQKIMMVKAPVVNEVKKEVKTNVTTKEKQKKEKQKKEQQTKKVTTKKEPIIYSVK